LRTPGLEKREEECKDNIKIDAQDKNQKEKKTDQN
jgi:hypothetical protein